MNTSPSRTCSVHRPVVAGRVRVPIGAVVVVIGGLLVPGAVRCGRAWRCSSPMSILSSCSLVLFFVVAIDRLRWRRDARGMDTTTGLHDPAGARGTVGMAAATHWAGAATAMGVLER